MWLPYWTVKEHCHHHRKFSWTALFQATSESAPSYPDCPGGGEAAGTGNRHTHLFWGSCFCSQGTYRCHPTPESLSLLWRGYNSRDPNKRKKPKEWPLTETLFLKVGLRTGSISISWEVIRNAESQAPLQTHWTWTERDPAFQQDPQVVQVHIQIWEALT